jgi:L-ribulose-5-phosphate 4-epimerase
MLSDLKKDVFQANQELVHRELVKGTWGNVSGIDRAQGLVVIKPSGLAYDAMQPDDMTVVSLADGHVVEGQYRPSSDTPTHLELYRSFGTIGGIVHTHSLYATAWAQAKQDIPALGTTHADHFHGPVRCTRPLRPTEIKGEYEHNTGRVIVECVGRRDPLDSAAVLVASHGPFAWGATPREAVENADVLEQIARMASETLRIAPRVKPMPTVLLDKHFLRKHGAGAYYGQRPGRR